MTEPTSTPTEPPIPRPHSGHYLQLSRVLESVDPDMRRAMYLAVQDAITAGQLIGLPLPAEPRLRVPCITLKGTASYVSGVEIVFRLTSETIEMLAALEVAAHRRHQAQTAGRGMTLEMLEHIGEEYDFEAAALVAWRRLRRQPGAAKAKPARR